MEINLDVNARKVLPEAGPTPVLKVPKRAGSTDTEFRAAAALNRALETQPEVRPEKVEAAKNLVGQPSYPPQETLQRIASLLAMQLNP